MRSAFSDVYFYQDLIMHKPHRSVKELLHPNHKDLPSQIRHFAAAWMYRPELWQNSDQIQYEFTVKGNKAHYVQTFVEYVHSRADFLQLWQRNILGNTLVPPDPSRFEETDLTANQLRVTKTVRDFLHHRQDYYNDIQEGPVTFDMEPDEQDDDASIVDTENVVEHTPVATTGYDWRQYVLVKGKPGTGKSHAIKVAIQQTLDNGYKVACATPTGFLQSTYRAEFIEDNFEANTIHSMFRYPVNSTERPQINWNVGQYDLLIVEELSMVPKKIFSHVANTLNQLHVRPVALLCGDQQQQQPIETVEGRTTQTKGILYDKEFYKSCIVFNFLEQHRCSDPLYQEYLNTLRYAVAGDPSESRTV